MQLNKEQLYILDHTIHRAARGLYCGDSPDMQKLMKMGLMESAGRKSFVPDEYFRITETRKENPQPSGSGGTKGTMKKEICDLPPVDRTALLGNKCGHQCRTLAGLHTCTLPKGHRFCHQEFRQLSVPNASWGDNDGQYPDSPNP